MKWDNFSGFWDCGTNGLKVKLINITKRWPWWWNARNIARALISKNAAEADVTAAALNATAAEAGPAASKVGTPDGPQCRCRLNPGLHS